MKANKALKRLTHAKDLISDVTKRYSASAPDTSEKLRDAKAAVGRAKDAVKEQASSRRASTPNKAVTKKGVVKVPTAKAVKTHGPTKQDLEG